MTGRQRSPRAQARAARAALAVVGVLALAACGGGGDEIDQPTATPTPEPPSVSTIAALGDSISLGVNSCDSSGPCLEASWALGDRDDVESLATRLAETGEQPDPLPLAVNGGTVADALAAVDEVVEAQPDLVTVLVGGNDACTSDFDTMTTADDYRAALEQILSRLESEVPDATVLVLSVPDLSVLWELGHDDERAVEAWNSSPSCRSLLQNADSMEADDEQRRAEVRERVIAFNEAIVELCDATSTCVHDDGALFEYPFGDEHISTIDYFHPSALGQAAIAEIAWRALTGAAR